MKKLSFKNKYEASYMAITFGVRVLVENPAWPSDGENPYTWTKDPSVICDWWIESKHYNSGSIHPDDYGIFQSQVGDLITGPNGTVGVKYELDKGYGKDGRVVLRNNRSFLWPESGEKSNG